MSFYDVIYFVIIGLIYCLFVYKFVEVIFKNQPYRDRTQKALVAYFTIGLIGIIIALALQYKFTNYNNPIIRKALIFASVLMILYATVLNWDKMSEEAKLIIIGIILVAIIWYVYKYKRNNEAFENTKIKKKIKKKLSQKDKEKVKEQVKIEILDELSKDSESSIK